MKRKLYNYDNYKPSLQIDLDAVTKICQKFIRFLILRYYKFHETLNKVVDIKEFRIVLLNPENFRDLKKFRKHQSNQDDSHDVKRLTKRIPLFIDRLR